MREATTETLKIGALIMAGGKNSRMGGRQKALLRDEEGVRYLDRLTKALGGFEERLLSTNDPVLSEGTGFLPVSDIYLERGPLGGLHAALKAAKSDALIVYACDMPKVTENLSAYLCESWRSLGEPKAMIVRDETGRAHPLCGIYRKTCLPVIEEMLSENCGRMMELFRRTEGVFLDAAEGGFAKEMFANINTPAEKEAL